MIGNRYMMRIIYATAEIWIGALKCYKEQNITTVGRVDPQNTVKLKGTKSQSI